MDTATVTRTPQNSRSSILASLSPFALDLYCMDPWESIAERKIREAMAEGAFDNLTGKGQPLDLAENPYEDPSLRMGYRLLRNNGFAPAWMEEAKDLERAIEESVQELVRDRAIAKYREGAAALNRRILAHNLKTPPNWFHMRAHGPEIAT